jgi:chemotaxis protein CheD
MQLATQVPEMNLAPGELHLTQRPMLIHTILGSCVGATFWSPRLGVGAMCHGVLPRCPESWPSGDSTVDCYRYVDYSIRYLTQKLYALGAKRNEVQVKLFGGADVLPTSNAPNAKPTVGALNCEAALQVLEQEGLPILAYDLGGTRGRKIRFCTRTGEVRVYKLAHWSESQ